MDLIGNGLGIWLINLILTSPWPGSCPVCQMQPAGRIQVAVERSVAQRYSGGAHFVRRRPGT